MLAGRLQARCRSAVPIGVARLSGYGIDFSKRSNDQSGKATLVRADNAITHGVMFEILRTELAKLDSAEGLGVGYERFDDIDVVCSRTGDTVKTSTYIALSEAIDSNLKPYDWYHALVMAGARQHNLPEPHIESLASAVFLHDTDLGRKSRIAALRAMDEAGYLYGLPYPTDFS